MNIQLTPHRAIHQFDVPYVIAELGANHNGDMDVARHLIEVAKEAGADCVKFQSWTEDSIFSRQKYEENYFLADDYRNRSDYSMQEIVREFSMSEKQLLHMRDYCRSVQIDFASTPFSAKEVDYLVDVLQAPFVKVASMDLNNYPFLKYIAGKGRPVILSTGLSELHEIDRAIRTIESTGNDQIILLHCVATYPPRDEDVNLNRIDSLRMLYPYPVGFSDHTLGITVPIGAVAKGACVIEKHLTLDKNAFGWDHKVSATPDELRKLVKGVRQIVRALGSSSIRSVESEEQRREFRRSIVTTRSLKAGETISAADIDFKRPGTGISPAEYDYVLGRTLRHDLQADYPIAWQDLV